MLKRSMFKNKNGISIVEMMIVSIIIGILCAISIPNFTRIRENMYRDKCITNLRRIVSAKEHWSLETGAGDADTPTAEELNPYVKDGTSSLVCPLDPNGSFATSYTINNMRTDPVCNIKPSTHKLE